MPLTPAQEAAGSAYRCSFTDPSQFAHAPRAVYTPPEHWDREGCPYCNADQHQLESAEPEFAPPDALTLVMCCTVCQAVWRETYHLTRFQGLDANEQEVGDEFPHTAEYLRERAYQSLVIASQDAYEALAGLPTARARQDILDDLCSALNHAEDHGQSLPL